MNALWMVVAAIGTMVLSYVFLPTPAEAVSTARSSRVATRG